MTDDERQIPADPLGAVQRADRASGSPAPSRRRRRRRPRPGRPSPTATTRWSSRRPGPARRWPRSCGPSTGSPSSEPRPATAGTRVLYVSPLKALAVDVERNLRTPLTGIGRDRRAARRARARHQRRRALRRHPARAAPRADHQAAGHPDHHARVAVPDADVGRPRDAGRGADGDRRRGARRRGHQTRRTPGAVAGAARPAAGPHPRSGSGCRRPSGRPRRWRGSCPGRPGRRSSRRRRPRPSTCRFRCRCRTWPTWRTTPSGPTSRSASST